MQEDKVMRQANRDLHTSSPQVVPQSNGTVGCLECPLVFETLFHYARTTPDAIVLRHGKRTLSYAELAESVLRDVAWLDQLGLASGDRVAIWGPKSPEQVSLLWAAMASGRVVVPINPLLKPAQVVHILADSGARLLVTDAARIAALDVPSGCRIETVDAQRPTVGKTTLPPVTSDHLAALFYTSGSTGPPKGVMISHGNLAAGAASVSEYLKLTANDRLLAVLPLSFDYGFSQLTTALAVGASVSLLDYLLPNDLKRIIEQDRITVLAGVPGLLIPLSRQRWLADMRSLRLITNSGGKLPVPTVRALRTTLPTADLVLMYGLTEAFRSTWLPPELVDKHPESIGQGIPRATVRVLDANGQPCAPGQSGELVQGGPLVAQGYWNDPQRSAQRFRPAPAGWPEPEQKTVVYSGDRVRIGEDGLLYFEGRFDEQIKTGGYRVSPEEIETVAASFPTVHEVLAYGVEDALLGQKIVLTVAPEHVDTEALKAHLAANLPRYMLPARIDCRPALPRSPNGKLDRRALMAES